VQAEREGPIVRAGVEDAIFDLEECGEFWQAVTGNSHSKRGLSRAREFLNQSVGTIAESIAQTLP
jgi:hypothetical protein